MQLSQGTQKLLEAYQHWYKTLEPQGEISAIMVDEVASQVASFYEKIRGVVDWREEHLLRKIAIERILKRRLFINGNAGQMAEPLLQELIRGGHFPNNRIPLEKIDEVQRIINKYTALLALSKPYLQAKAHLELQEWIVPIESSEIQEILIPPLREKALIALMAEEMVEQIELKTRGGGAPSGEDKILLVFTAVHRALFKVDDSTIALHMLERSYPDWDAISGERLSAVAQRIATIKHRIDTILSHPLGEKVYQLIELHDTPYLILGDMISRNPNEFIQLAENSKNFETAIGHFYYQRLLKLKGRMRRAAIFSTLSVFLSKVLVALAVEIPIDTHVTKEFNYSAVWLSIAIPPLFLLFLLSAIRTSSEENFQRVLLEVAKITYERKQKDVYPLPIPRRRGGILEVFVRVVYLLSFFLVFGALAWSVRQLNFSYLSIFVFLLFFSLVAYAGTRIRNRSRELIVGEEKQGFLWGVFEFFLLPVVQVGKWLSAQLPKYNILVILLNVLIEAPFQLFVEFIEQLRTFWKEKKEEIR